jgi:hypothetical protein
LGRANSLLKFARDSRLCLEKRFCTEGLIAKSHEFHSRVKRM